MYPGNLCKALHRFGRDTILGYTNHLQLTSRLYALVSGLPAITAISSGVCVTSCHGSIAHCVATVAFNPRQTRVAATAESMGTMPPRPRSQENLHKLARSPSRTVPQIGIVALLPRVEDIPILYHLSASFSLHRGSHTSLYRRKYRPLYRC